MLRDRLLARMAAMGEAPDHQQLVAEVLGIRGASPELARRLVAQALVLEDRRDTWRQTGERICREAPALPGVYVLRDAEGRPLYVGKAVNLRRRLRAHFAARRWRALKRQMALVADADWRTVGSELEALLREAELIQELGPEANVQVAPPSLATRAIPSALVGDVIAIVPSAEEESAELIAARPDGAWMMQRTRRNGADLTEHTFQLRQFFEGVAAAQATQSQSPLAPIVFSWLAGRGATSTRVDPRDLPTAGDLAARLAVILSDEQLFVDRIIIHPKASRSGKG